METRALGKSGLLVSVVGLGCNNFGAALDLAATRKVVDRALDLGITLIDTADVYGNRGDSERFLGEILGDRRKDIVLATKFASPMDKDGRLSGASRRYIVSAVEASLKRLRTDWIDLYQLHRPDPETPIEETLRALDDLISQGKVRYVGCSKLSPWRVTEAHWTAKHLNLNRFISCQDEYNLLSRAPEGDLMSVIQTYGMGLLPYYPLASGLLTGKYKPNAPLPAGARLSNPSVPSFGKHYMTEANLAIVERLGAFAAASGHTMLELAFSWLLSHSAVASVIAGATRPEQIEQNVRAAGWKLTSTEIAEIDRLIRQA